MCLVLSGGGDDVQGLIMFASLGLTRILLQIVLALCQSSQLISKSVAAAPARPGWSLVDSSGEKSAG